MRPSDRLRLGLGVALLVALPLVANHARSLAAVASSVDNPHGSFKEECALCHDAKGWKPARISPKFDHSKFGFPLTGAHAAAECRTCHETLEFKQSKTLCISCHEDPHRGEMGADCARCHGARSFVDRGPMVRAHQLTRFPLTGSHAALDCESCHPPAAQGQMQFVGTRAECESCHMRDYDATRNPDHRAGGFPTDCSLCHRPISWNGASFDHNKTAFPLTGAHRTVACAQCHGDGVYQGKSTACVSCHLGDYNATNNPAHAGAGFTTQCASCHTTAAWQPANFDHDTSFFPIYSGTHNGRWSACSDCHTSASNYLVFTCLSCHPHDSQTQTDSNHSGVHNYQYNSQACYSCHPRGRAG